MKTHRFYIENGNDNVNYLIQCEETGVVAAIDPTEASRSIEELEKLGWKLDIILCTHHHWDHTDGNAELVTKYGCDVYGCATDAQRIPHITHKVAVGEKLHIGNMQGEVMALDGHTIGHVGYYFPEQKALFSGDTIFAMGCGRLFEGTAEQMFANFQKVKTLPHDTIIYTAHEYTLTNARFAHQVLPKNDAIIARLKEVEGMRAQGELTVPMPLSIELQTNPFFLAENVEQFAQWREVRNRF